MGERLDTARNALTFALDGFYRDALRRSICVVIGHRYDHPGLLQECSRCQWSRLNPHVTLNDLRATKASLDAAQVREAVFPAGETGA